MPFIIISSKGTEIGRRGIVGGITVGRAADCDLCVHDILLSRHHCRIEPSGRGWVVLDMRSKNGTWLDGERIGRRSLRHGEAVRVGKTTLRFMMGELPAGASKSRSRTTNARPADPFEAMAGTVVDFDASQADEKAPCPHFNGRMPYPRPIPREPVSYAQDGVYSLLEQIASSSWDSIYANASRPTRPAPEVVVGNPTVAAAPVANSVKHPAVPSWRQSLDSANAAPRNTLPVRSTSRLQADFSLQAPAVRAPRLVRTPLAQLDVASPAPATFHLPKRKSTVRRAWHAIGRALVRLRRRISPPGAVMLF